MESSPKVNPYERRHDLDWLRFIAILILLFFHTGMLFNSWGWHVKNPQTHDSFRYWMIWLHEWRMPLLLFISGAGTFMALGKRTTGQYARERFKRLIIPLVFGMFIIVPPQIYFEHFDKYDSYADFYHTVFEFVPYPRGSFSWHHLWFIAYLFFYSLLGLPFLLFLRSTRSARFKQKMVASLSGPAGILFIPSFLMAISQAILRPFFPDETHALFNDWAYFVFYFLFFLFGMLAYSDQKLWARLGQHRNNLLAAALLPLIPFYLLYFHFTGIIRFPWNDDTVDILFSIIAIFVSWFTVVTVIAFGQHYLNRPHRWLKHFNEGLYPFYILHQTLIIVIGFYISTLPWSIFLKYWSVIVITLIGCMAMYFVAIRPWNIMRVLFGMKTLNKKQEIPEVRLAEKSEGLRS